MSAQDLEQVDRTDRELLVEFIRICREHKPVGQWPGERLCTAIERMMEREKPFRFIAEADMAPERGHNGRGGDVDRPFSGPRRAAPNQPAPVADDARMARALEWVQVMAMQDADGSHVPAIQEAIAAYDPNCGARTVRLVDDAMVERYLTAVHKHLGGLPREQWNRYREDGGATLRRIARIGLTAALARAQGVQS